MCRDCPTVVLIVGGAWGVTAGDETSSNLYALHNIIIHKNLFNFEMKMLHYIFFSFISRQLIIYGQCSYWVEFTFYKHYIVEYSVVCIKPMYMPNIL